MPFLEQSAQRELPFPLDRERHRQTEMDGDIGRFYEFFSGAGMARAGLGSQWRCLFANDIDRKKAATYSRNWGAESLLCGDVKGVTAGDLPGYADLTWASFPCQDLSLAGSGAGLSGERSGTFWPFWRLMLQLVRESRAPSVIVLENVCGALTSHGGKDFETICRALRDGGYRVGPLVVDAALFVPQSRPRLLIVAVKDGVIVPNALTGELPDDIFHTRSLTTAFGRLPSDLQEAWIWWRLPTPPVRSIDFPDLFEDDPKDVAWHTTEQTQKLLDMMSGVNRAKVRSAQQTGRKVIGTVYKRTRRDESGRKVQRAEVRFDNIAGCLRTPAGGSSRQLVVVVEGRKVRSRLISSRETARLMGLPDEYILPENYNEAYHLTGDGVVVPVVRFLANEIFEPILLEMARAREAA